MRKSSIVSSLVLLVVLVTMLAVSGCGSAAVTTTSSTATSSSTAPAGTIKIGLLTTVGGPFSTVVAYFNTPVFLAVDQINAAGGINGKKIELVVKDDGFDPSNAPLRLAEMKQEGCVAVIGAFNPGSLSVMISWAADNHIPAMVSGLTSMTGTKYNKYVFNSMPPNYAFAKAFALSISKQDIKSIMFVGGDTPYMQETPGFFWNIMKTIKPGVTNLGTIIYGTSESDFSNLITSIMSKNPDMVNGVFGGPAYANFIKQATQFGLLNKTKFDGMLNLAADNTNPFVNHDFPLGIQSLELCPYWLNTPEMQAYTKAHLAMSQIYPSSLSYPYYVSTLGLIAGLKAANSTDPDAIANALESVTFNTPTGPVQYNDFAHQAMIPIWTETSTNDPSWPLPIGTDLVKYGNEIYPTKAELTTINPGLVKP